MSDNFIGVYENVVPATLCNDIISFFESCDKLGLTRTRQQDEQVSKLKKHDDLLMVPSTKVLEMINYDVLSEFATLFWVEAYKKYADKYDVLTDLASHQIYSFKMQRTPIGGGYHIWHCEQGDRFSSGRILTFTCYLNDVVEGGETEFLYYPKRVPATQGTFLIFPGGFTHTHRGNPPLSNTKYIITGWVQF
jgi:hypothetical protein